jgi:serine protease Do
MKHPTLRIFHLLLVIILLAVACGQAEPTPDVEATVAAAITQTEEAKPTDTPVPPTATPKPTDTPVPTPTPKSLVVSSLDDIQSAVVQIVAQGTFIDPAEGLQLNAAGSGSGFIIDESGIAVTNNHVVTGAALLKVWIGGKGEPRNAKVLGVSECSDLAIIDIEGDGYPYFEWYTGEIKPGLDIYAAGFPLGDPEFTLTRGIVSKARADGETNWASVDAVIEHDATINPGNSGGPLVTADGKVVGVNYAGASELGQFFAIAPDEALPVIEKLRRNQDVDSIGINGTAISSEDGFSGIWAASVKSGSPADKTGIKAGDIVTSIEGLSLATDGTMADYCDVLRTHTPDDIMSVQVLRFETEEFLEGQLNGRELALSFSFAQALGDEVGDETGDTTATTTYEYVTLVDDSDAIQLEVPVQWSDTNGSNWLFEDEVVGSALSAAPNFEDFLNTFSTPGVFFGASSVLVQRYDVNGLLDRLHSDICTYEGRTDYSDELYTGAYDLYSDCGDTNSIIIDVVAEPADKSFLMWLEIQVVDDADLDALDHILNSFQVIGELPGGSTSSAPSPPTPTTDASADIPAEWFPPAGKATIVLVNEASADLVFTMANQEHKLVANTEKVTVFDPGTYTYTASDPRFDSLNAECSLSADTIYYWYTDDNNWGSCFQVWP